MDERLLDGVEKYGFGEWKKIIKDKTLHKKFTGLTSFDLKYKHERLMRAAGAR